MRARRAIQGTTDAGMKSGDRGTPTFHRFWCAKIRGEGASLVYASPPQQRRMTAVTVLTTHEEPKRRSNGAARPVLVSARALAAHLCCVPSYVNKLVDQGVLTRRDDGRFDQDACRSKYIAHLREARKVSPRGAADTAFTAAKAELIQIRIMEKRRELVKQTEVDALIDGLFGVLLPALSSLPAQCAGRDLVMRRKIDAAVFTLRADLAAFAERRADEAAEPALEDQ